MVDNRTMNSPKLIDAVAGRLSKYMGERNLTQYKLAQLCNVPFTTVKSIMQRRANGVTLKTLILIADGLKIPVSEFMDDPSFNVDNLDL